MANNFAYYLDSDNENYVKTLKLVLNVNNKAQKKQAVNKFNDLADATCKNAGIEVPKGLKDALKKSKVFAFDADTYFVTLELEKNKIETWIMTIGTK